MSGGGATPTKTLWKLKNGESFICGQFQDGKLLIEGPDNGSIFVINADGQIAQISYSPSDEGFIDGMKQMFSQYFGEIESVGILVVTNLAIGDDIPNWEEYKLLS